MKHIVILRHDGGEMGNQLWNYASIYAYAIDRGYVCENWSFFEYSRYFQNTTPSNILIQRFFFTPFVHCAKRRSSFKTKLYRFLYKVLVVVPIEFLCARWIIYSRVPGALYYLPPTKETEGLLAENEKSLQPTYFSFVSGGVFRNPIGLKKYHSSIARAFAPASFVAETRDTFMAPLRKHYRHVVGVHVRQGDYEVFKGGKYAIPQERVREILSEYCRARGVNPEQVCFAITSDGVIKDDLFADFHIVVSKHTVGEDLFILASCDAIIGSDSTFGNFASYLGNIPHIIIKRDPIDWNYYAGKNEYFINKYFTVMLN